jgi:hypothetical protein
MPHVATRVLPFRSPHSVPHSIPAAPLLGNRRRASPALREPTSISPDLDAAYGMISGVVLVLLMWVGLLLPMLYFLV